MKAAAKLIELQAGQFIWHGAGTRHSATLHAASTIERGAVFVRSDSDTVHVLTAQSARQGIAYRVCVAGEDSSIFSVPPRLEDIVEAEDGESTTPNTRSRSWLRHPGLGTLATSNPDIQAVGSWA
jgi:hypothetical protein